MDAEKGQTNSAVPFQEVTGDGEMDALCEEIRGDISKLTREAKFKATKTEKDFTELGASFGRIKLG